MQRFKFIDLFCGIGGFHQAMQSLGGECVFACDIDEYCRQSYTLNYGIDVAGDITEVDERDIPAHDVLCAGFPCQSFSIAGKRLGFADPTKGTLFFEIMRIVRHHRPKYLLLENVKNLASHDGGNTWRIIRESLVAEGYDVAPMPVIFSPHYIGIPQRRERVIIMGIRCDVGKLPPFYFDRASAPDCSIYSVLQDDDDIARLDRFRLKPGDVAVLEHWNSLLKHVRTKVKKMPMFCIHEVYLKPSTSMIKGFDKFPTPKAVVARKNVILYNKMPEFIDNWLAEARSLPKFRGARTKMEWHAGNPDEPDIWQNIFQIRQSGIRVRTPEVCPTLTATILRPAIGVLRRYLTPRECARLQSFPETFKIERRNTQAYKQFGNAVNVEVVRIFARFLFGDPATRARYSRPTDEA